MESRAVSMVYAPYSIYEKDFAKLCTVKGHEPNKLFGNDITMTTDKPEWRMYSEYPPSPKQK